MHKRIPRGKIMTAIKIKKAIRPQATSTYTYIFQTTNTIAHYRVLSQQCRKQ